MSDLRELLEREGERFALPPEAWSDSIADDAAASAS